MTHCAQFNSKLKDSSGSESHWFSMCNWGEKGEAGHRKLTWLCQKSMWNNTVIRLGPDDVWMKQH